MSMMYVWRGARPSVNWNRVAGTSYTPALNVREDSEGYTLELVAPGLSAEAFDLTLEHKVLTVRGTYPTPDEGQRYVWREQPAGSFARSVRFTRPIDAEGIAARYEQGVLTVRIPKAAEVQPRKITVNVPEISA
ncbi:MAG: Hsp20/alpha crystallin family protein [Oscillochloris sp.]|nr:Hsp20/alpha crystallin family protein [Oscillochloris sp.]